MIAYVRQQEQPENNLPLRFESIDQRSTNCPFFSINYHFYIVEYADPLLVARGVSVAYVGWAAVSEEHIADDDAFLANSL